MHSDFAPGRYGNCKKWLRYYLDFCKKYNHSYAEAKSDPSHLIFRSYLKKVFWPNFCVAASFQLLEILKYACGLKLAPALNLNQNPIFEIPSKMDIFSKVVLSFEKALVAFIPHISHFISHHFFWK